ncbi:MAG: DUF2254 domain-containing protein [Candidatus Izemoplasmatales bacterium]
MKKLINFIQSKFYFKFIFYMFIFLGFSILFYMIDKNSNLSTHLRFSQEFLEDFLIMMLAAIITMVTITFSIIMVVLTLYSGQFSPRTLNDFLQRKVPLNTLAYYIGVSIFSLVSLVLSETKPNTLYSFTTLFAIIIFILSLILFAYFIHYVAKSVQINVYIDKMVKEAVINIEKQQKEIEEDTNILFERNDEDEEKEYKNEYTSKHTGYLIDINKTKLLNYLQENDLSITVNIPLNEHIYEGDILFKYQGNSSFNFDDDVINACFTISDEIGSFSEYREKTMKLVEIAVRALSPGTNDPFTAQICIQQLGFIFMKLSDNYYSLYYHDDSGKERIMIKTLNYKDLLYDHFYQIYLYGKGDLTIISALLKAFTRIAGQSNQDMKDSLWDFAEYVIKDIDIKQLHVFDSREVKIPLKDLAYQCRKLEKYKSMIE